MNLAASASYRSAAELVNDTPNSWEINDGDNSLTPPLTPGERLAFRNGYEAAKRELYSALLDYILSYPAEPGGHEAAKRELYSAYTAPTCPRCGHELVSGADGAAECGECGD